MTLSVFLLVLTKLISLNQFINNFHSVNLSRLSLSMSLVESIEEFDPKEPVSPADLARLILKTSFDQCNEHLKNNIDRANEPTYEKLEFVIKGISSEIRAASHTLNSLNTTQSKKIADLELKLDTFMTCHEQLPYTQNQILQHP